MKTCRPSRRAAVLMQRVARAGQRGISLVFAMIALAALSLAAVALVRSIDTGVLVLGNVGLKQSATISADQATRQALDWLNANAAALGADLPANGYYATVNTQLDVTGTQESNATRDLVDWNGDGCDYAAAGTYRNCITPAIGNDVNGYRARYVISRLCTTVGEPDATGNSCAQPLMAQELKSADQGVSTYSNSQTSPTVQSTSPYYRVVVRMQAGVSGNASDESSHETASYTETIVHF